MICDQAIIIPHDLFARVAIEGCVVMICTTMCNVLVLRETYIVV